MVRRTIFSLGLALVVAAQPLMLPSPAAAKDNGNRRGDDNKKEHANQIVLQSAYAELDEGYMTLRGEFGDGNVTVWLAGLQLDLLRWPARIARSPRRVLGLAQDGQRAARALVNSFTPLAPPSMLNRPNSPLRHLALLLCTGPCLHLTLP